MGDYTGDEWTFTDTTGNYNDDSGAVDDNIAPYVPPPDYSLQSTVNCGCPNSSWGKASPKV